MSSTRRPKRFSADRLQQVHREAGLAAADGQAEPGRSADPAEAGLPDHGQEDIWFFEQFTPEALVHQVALVVRIDGPVVLPALRRAVRSLVERHEALRARYSVVDGAPRLTIAPAPGDDAVLHDRTEERAWGDLLDREVHRPFDLATGPLVRFVLGRPAGGRHELLIVLHHIIADGRTLVLLQRDLVAAYTAAVRGDEPPSGSSGDLRDIVGGRRAAVDRHWVADQLKRRIAELDDLPAAAERWPSFGRPAAEGSDPFAADSVAITLPAPLAADVRSIAAAERATPLMIWLTALTVLIHRVSATDDVVVGTVMDGRRDDASRDLAGYLANVVALRIRPAVDSTWRDVLRAVRSSVLAAFDDSDVPFRHVVERVSPERRPDVHPVFQILLTPQQAQDPPTPVDGVTFAVTERLSRRSLYELEFHLLDGPGATTGRLRFRTRSLDREAAQRTAERFVRLVGELTRDPDGRFDANDVLSTAERQDAVGDGRVTVTSRPDGDTVHRRFESFADAMPDACAVECSELRVTYGELDEDANRLARRLRAGGLRPEDRVGILPARADQWVRAALAVLKSGGAYVPLDGAWPGALLAEVCADAGIAMVVSDDAHLAAAAVTGAPVVRLDDTVAESSGRLDEPAGARRLACVTYTVSASGRPLGSAVEHRGITDRAQGIPDLRAGGPVLAQAADPTLDAAGLEVWGALLNGGRLVAVTEDATENADVLAEQVQAGGINTLLVSADFAHRLAREAPDVAGRLKRLIVLGERPDRNALKRLSAAGGPRLYAAYGATETATITALRDCSGISSDDRPITMGRPVASNRWYVLDRSLRPVPRGGRGELHIGGEGVARGYFRAPALTAERFVPDPFGEPGSRLFRTGDLVLRRTDGELEFLGRIDRRTRIGGRGVDPASVEACLRASRMVSDAAVQIRSGPDGRRRLVGYVVPAAGSGLDAVREHLRRHLPPWLIPSAIIEMPAIPRTRRGTPEYGALPGPAWRAEPSRRDPATSSERRVHTAWRDVLEIPGVGVDENFFAVGGHSLSAVRVASRLSTDFGVPVTARLLFEHPTVAETAAALDELVRTKAPSGAEAAGDAPIKAVRRGGRSIADLLTDSAAARAPREPHPAETTDEGVDQRD